MAFSTTRRRRPRGPASAGVAAPLAGTPLGAALAAAAFLGACSPTPAAPPAPAAAPDPAAGSAVSTSAAEPGAAPAATPAARAAELAREDVPVAMRACFGCHRRIVAAYLDHGMARSLGPLGEPPRGTLENPRTRTRYELAVRDGESRLEATLPDGGRRVQKLVGRIGAGNFDVSWVGAELDTVTGEDTGRLFFAPVETVTGHGLELSPFELSAAPSGLDLALVEGCLTCHTDDRLETLPGAATAGGRVYPPNALGADAFAHLSGLGCDACHGDGRRHVELMAGVDEGFPGDLGIASLAALDAGRQRDVCARCHLQGDARIDLTGARPDPDRPLAGQIPVLVPARQGEDFRFVSQLERLARSSCFRASPGMTCTTCHDPHASVAAQGVASFDAACRRCHDLCSRPAALAVETVTGEPARSAEGCVDCHVRRSQPFDLPHVRSADHWIRRRIPPPEEVPYRQFADPGGALEVYDDGRLAAAFATAAGARWRDGVLAMGLVTMGRVEDAAARFVSFPAPGRAAATAPASTVPRELEPLERQPSFHVVRALALLGTSRVEPAHAAYGDALALDPLDAGARLGRARLRLDRGDLRGAVEDTQAVIDAYPRAEQPWALRAEMAERAGRADLAARAFEEYVRRWPSNAVVWTKLGLLRRQQGDEVGARDALARAKALRPSFSLPPATR